MSGITKHKQILAKGTDIHTFFYLASLELEYQKNTVAEVRVKVPEAILSKIHGGS